MFIPFCAQNSTLTQKKLASKIIRLVWYLSQNASKGGFETNATDAKWQNN